MGADVTSTTRHFSRLPEEQRPDFHEDVTGPEVDRGRGTHLVNTRHQVLHGMTNAPVQYALLEHAWDGEYENRSNVVDVYVRYLREKVDRPFGVESIETVRGAGYRLRADGGRT